MKTPKEATSTEEFGIAPAGYRLPREARVGAVRLQVADLERSLRYYRDILGFEVANRSEETAALRAREGGEPLVELRARAGTADSPSRGRFGLYHFAVLLPSRGDLGRFLRHLLERGERFGASDHHVSEALYLTDPDGLGIEVYADRPRAKWERRGRELRMETLPLDVPSLLEEAGEGGWSGLPAGTRLGHLHLHVGDLREAARFYADGLGLNRIVWSYPGALFLAAGGYHHHLGLNTWAGSHARGRLDDEAGLLEWEVVLPTAADVDAAADSVEQAGYTIQREPRSWSAEDPWGTRLRVVCYR
jgi:catechol 2,3-dioxygenase